MKRSKRSKSASIKSVWLGVLKLLGGLPLGGLLLDGLLMGKLLVGGLFFGKLLLGELLLEGLPLDGLLMGGLLLCYGASYILCELCIVWELCVGASYATMVPPSFLA